MFLICGLKLDCMIPRCQYRKDFRRSEEDRERADRIAIRDSVPEDTGASVFSQFTFTDQCGTRKILWIFVN